MRIQVTRNFSGRVTGERWIEAGEYDADDERLLGCAEYMLANGHARVIGDVAAVIDVTEAAELEPAEIESVDVIVMPGAEEPAADVAVYEHQGRKLKAGKPKS